MSDTAVLTRLARANDAAHLLMYSRDIPPRWRASLHIARNARLALRKLRARPMTDDERLAVPILERLRTYADSTEAPNA